MFSGGDWNRLGRGLARGVPYVGTYEVKDIYGAYRLEKHDFFGGILVFLD